MSKVSVTLVRQQYRVSSLPVSSDAWVPIGASENLTSAAGAVTTSLAATSQADSDRPENYRWRVANLGTDHVHMANVAPGGSATATSPGLPAGTVDYLAVGAFGDNLSVINA